MPVKPRLDCEQQEANTIPNWHQLAEQSREKAECLSLWLGFELPNDRIDEKRNTEFYADQKDDDEQRYQTQDVHGSISSSPQEL